jgi:phosphatidylserine/phosphatidylglycerophosphate/cardiolipin synthase-like enzyme
MSIDKIIQLITKLDMNELVNVQNRLLKCKKNGHPITDLAIINEIFNHLLTNKEKLEVRNVLQNSNAGYSTLELIIQSQYMRAKAIYDLDKPKFVATNPLKHLVQEDTETYQTFNEYVNNAKSEIILLGYKFTYDELLPAITNALRRKVRMLVIGEEKDFIWNISQKLHLYSNLIDYYIFDADYVKEILGSDAKYASFHAKVLVIDGIAGMVSSANFTYSGMETNVEIGMKIGKKDAELIKNFMLQLVDNGILYKFH